MKIDDSYIGRRRFLGGMLGGGAAALGIGVAAPLIPYVGNLRPEPIPPFIQLDPDEYDLAPGTSRIVLYGQIPALLFKTPEGQLKVFVATCTHLDCTVTYKADENCIFCACHEGRYDLDGRVISGPPPRNLPAFYHRIEDGKLVIALEQENLEKARGPSTS